MHTVFQHDKAEIEVEQARGFSCQYHIVFCPKYRRKVLNEPIAARFKEIVNGLAVEFGQEVIEMEVLPDHVHLLCAVDPQFGVAKWVRYVKGRTSRSFAVFRAL